MLLGLECAICAMLCICLLGLCCLAHPSRPHAMPSVCTFALRTHSPTLHCHTPCHLYIYTHITYTLAHPVLQAAWDGTRRSFRLMFRGGWALTSLALLWVWVSLIAAFYGATIMVNFVQAGTRP